MKIKIITILMGILTIFFLFEYVMLERNIIMDSKAYEIVSALEDTVAMFYYDNKVYPTNIEIKQIIFGETVNNSSKKIKNSYKIEDKYLNKIIRFEGAVITIKCGIAYNTHNNKKSKEIDVIYNEKNGLLSFRKGYKSANGKIWQIQTRKILWYEK